MSPPVWATRIWHKASTKKVGWNKQNFCLHEQLISEAIIKFVWLSKLKYQPQFTVWDRLWDSGTDYGILGQIMGFWDRLWDSGTDYAHSNFFHQVLDLVRFCTIEFFSRPLSFHCKAWLDFLTLRWCSEQPCWGCLVVVHDGVSPRVFNATRLW